MISTSLEEVKYNIKQNRRNEKNIKYLLDKNEYNEYEIIEISHAMGAIASQAKAIGESIENISSQMIGE